MSGRTVLLGHWNLATVICVPQTCEALCLIFFTNKQALLASVRSPSLFLIKQASTHIFAFRVFTVDLKIAFLNLQVMTVTLQLTQLAHDDLLYLVWLTALLILMRLIFKDSLPIEWFYNFKQSRRAQVRSLAPSESPWPRPTEEMFPAFTPLTVSRPEGRRMAGWQREGSHRRMAVTTKRPSAGYQRGNRTGWQDRISGKVDLKKLHSTTYCCNTQVC